MNTNPLSKALSSKSSESLGPRIGPVFGSGQYAQKSKVGVLEQTQPKTMSTVKV